MCHSYLYFMVYFETWFQVFIGIQGFGIDVWPDNGVCQASLLGQ